MIHPRAGDHIIGLQVSFKILPPKPNPEYEKKKKWKTNPNPKYPLKKFFFS